MFKRLRGWVNRKVDESAFKPTWMGLLVNPFYIARRAIHAHVQAMAKNVQGGSLLDVGCGTKPYRSFFNVDEYIGLEIETTLNRENKDVDVFYSGDRFPFEESRFDSVVCFQVFEHVFNPDQFMAELARVTKDGGLLLMSVPFVWDEHEQPYDYARYSSFGLTHVLETHGFEVVEQRKSVSGVDLLCQLVNGYIFKKTQHWPARLRLLSWMVLCTPVTAAGLIGSRVLPAHPDLYLDNLILARRKCVA